MKKLFYLFEYLQKTVSFQPVPVETGGTLYLLLVFVFYLSMYFSCFLYSLYLVDFPIVCIFAFSNVCILGNAMWAGYSLEFGAVSNQQIKFLNLSDSVV